MAKGQISSIVEIYFGVIIILFIMFSSFYFAERSEVQGIADITAVNSGMECYNNLNILLKTDNIFQEKTSIRLGKSTELQADLERINNSLSEIRNFNLFILDECTKFKEGCTNSDSIAEIINSDSSQDSKKCAFPIPRETCGEDSICTIFLKMEMHS